MLMRLIHDGNNEQRIIGMKAEAKRPPWAVKISQYYLNIIERHGHCHPCGRSSLRRLGGRGGLLTEELPLH